MRNRYRSEKIGLAISEDLEHFIEYKNTPVLTPDEGLFVVRAKGEKTDCRDMNIVYDEENEIYYGYFAAMANVKNRGEIGVIGVAESFDLINWNNQKIVYVPYFNGVVEVPNVFKSDGKWYMTLLTGSMYGAKQATNESDLTCFTISACSESPNGMFKDAGVFLGGTQQSGYACRCVDYRGKTYVMYIDRSEYGAAISLPKEIKITDGEPKPYYTSVLQNMRTGRKRRIFEFEKIPSAWPWGYVSGGSIKNSGNLISVCADDSSFQGFMIKDFKVCSLESEFILSGDFKEAGFVLLCYSENENLWGRCAENEYYIAVNKSENTLILYGNMLEPICRRKLETVKEKRHIRVIAMEGQLEVYLDDILFIQQGIKTEMAIAGGLFSACGNADFRNLQVYELE